MLTTNSFKQDESSVDFSNSTLSAATRKANNLFQLGRNAGSQVNKGQLDQRAREQRVSDSGNSSAGSIMSASSSDKASKRSAGNAKAGVDEEIGSMGGLIEEVASGTSTFTVNNNDNEMKDVAEANSNATSLDLENVVGLEEEPSYQDMLHGNVRRMSNTVSPF